MTRHPVLQTPEAQPWWRYGMVWLVLGGPAAVVVASLVTGYIAFRKRSRRGAAGCVHA